MRIEELIDFSKLSSYNSFSSAANDLFTSRYNLMRNITNLENDLGIKLFDRKNNGIYLTEAGKEILDEVSVILDHYKNMMNIANSTRAARPVIRVGCYANNSTTYAMNNVIKLCNASQDEYVAEFVVVDQKNLLSMVRDGEIDFAFTIEKSTDEGLVSYPIVKREVFGLVNKDNKLATEEYISDKVLEKSKIVIPLLTGGTERILVKEYGDSISENIALKSNDFYYLFSYVSNYDCIGVFNGEDSEAAQKIFDNIIALPIKPAINANLCLLTIEKKGRATIKKHFVDFVAKNYNRGFK